MKKNITIVGLVNNYKKQVAKTLADELEMVFADVNDIMEFNLINSKMIEIIGQKYFDENEEKTVKTLSTYENTVITLNFSTLNKNNNIESLKKNSLIIYLRLNFDTFIEVNKAEVVGSLQKINGTAFNERDYLLKKISEIVVNIDEIDIANSVKNIIREIGNYYK